MEEQGTTWGERALSELFGSDVRASVLSWICAHPDELIVGAKLARELEMSPSAVGKELARLENLGMLEAAEPIGAAKPYTLNQQFPMLRGLRSMCLYATGVVAVLRELFADAEGVEVAAIFGSLARGDDHPESDVDVLVVGEIDGLELARLASEARRQTGRDVMTAHYSPKELAEKARETGSFIDRVLTGSLIAVKGDVDGLRRLATDLDRRESMAADGPSIEEIQDDIMSFLRENRGYTRQQLDDQQGRWNLQRFAEHIEADERDIQRALTELCEEGLLMSFPEVGKGRCYSLDD